MIAGYYKCPPGSFQEYELFAWKIVRILDFSGGCGNGMGRFCGQYQFDPHFDFQRNYKGIWDPKTETKLGERHFTLRTSGDLIDAFYLAIKNKKLEEFRASPEYITFLNRPEEKDR